MVKKSTKQELSITPERETILELIMIIEYPA